MAASSFSPAGSEIEPVRQEHIIGSKLIQPCRIENKTCEAGALRCRDGFIGIPEEKALLELGGHYGESIWKMQT